MILSMSDFFDWYNADNNKIKTFESVLIINTKSGKLLTTEDLLFQAGRVFTITDLNKKDKVKKFRNNEKIWSQLYSFRLNNGIAVNKSQNDDKMYVDVSESESGGVQDNNQVITNSWHGGASQLWAYDQGTQKIKLKDEELYLTTKNDQSDNDTEIIASSNPGT